MVTNFTGYHFESPRTETFVSKGDHLSSTFGGDWRTSVLLSRSLDIGYRSFYSQDGA